MKGLFGINNDLRREETILKNKIGFRIKFIALTFLVDVMHHVLEVKH